MTNPQTGEFAAANKTILAAAAVSLLFAVAATAANADDIKAQVPAGQLADYCRTAGVGSEETATFMLPDMKRLTGTVRCEAQDLLATSAPANYADDEDNDGVADRNDDGGDMNDDHD